MPPFLGKGDRVSERFGQFLVNVKSDQEQNSKSTGIKASEYGTVV